MFKRIHASISQSSSAIAIEDESLASLRALLQNEIHPLYACGRAYLSNLTMWRDHLASQRGGLSESGAVAVGPVGRAMTPLREMTSSSSTPTSRTAGVAAVATPSNSRSNDDASYPLACHKPKSRATDHPTASRSSKKKKKVVASPDRNPDLLFQWREQMVEHFFNSAKRMKYEPNTAIVALAFLDTYSMRVCFPEEYYQREQRYSGHMEDEEEDTSLSARKRRKSNSHHADHDDYLYEYVENSREHQQHEKLFREDATVKGMDRCRYALAAITSLYLASKVYQSTTGHHSSSQLSNAYGAFSTAQIEEMEVDILQTLGFRVHTPTSLRFIQEMLPLLLITQVDNSFALDSSPWTPQDDVEKRINSGAVTFATLASSCDTEKFPPILSASPSKIALAAIVEAAGRVFHKRKHLVRQHEFLERLFSPQAVVPYDDEVRTVQECLANIWRLNNQKDDVPREGSPATVIESLPEASKDSTEISSSYTLENKENRQAVVPSKEKLDKSGANPSVSSCAAIHRAVSQSSAGGRIKKKSRKCSEGRNHRMWERPDQCALAATATSRFYRHFPVS